MEKEEAHKKFLDTTEYYFLFLPEDLSQKPFLAKAIHIEVLYRGWPAMVDDERPLLLAPELL